MAALTALDFFGPYENVYHDINVTFNCMIEYLYSYILYTTLYRLACLFPLLPKY